MKNPAALAGLLVAVVALGVAALFYGQKESAEADLLAANERSPTPDSVLYSVTDRAVEPPSTSNSTDLEALREELAAAEKRIEVLESEATASDSDATEAEAEDAEDDDTPKGFDDFLEQLLSNPQANAQMRGLTGITYADFFAGTELDPDSKSALQDLLVDSQIAQIAITQFAMQEGDITGRELAQWEQEEHDRLSDQVRDLLDKEDFENWEDYADSIGERAIRASLENQIPAFASGLTPENLALVLDVAVEEFVGEQDAIRQTDEVYTPAEPMLFQLRAMQAMRDRLGPILPEDQFRELDNWLTMGENVMRSSLPKEEKSIQDS